MTMLVEGFEDSVEVSDRAELLKKLRTERRDGFGSFTLVGNDSSSLAIMINGEFALVYFFPDDEGNHAGFEPIGMTPRDCPASVFVLQTTGESGDGFEIPAAHIVSAETAYAAASEYFETHQLPSAITWTEL